VNVLSLFDGISCGQIALERAKIDVENYYASEIDKYAIQVTQHNYPKTIQLGDINNWREWELPKIDLILAGSPCTGFSNAGQGLNFEDPQSKLFFVFVDILNHYKEKNPNLYWLLENVKMKKEWSSRISDLLGTKFIEINSSLVSAQNRKRLYWTNIPNVTQPNDRHIYLKDIIIDRNDDLLDIETPTSERLEYIKRRAKNGWVKSIYNTINTEKVPCLTAVCYKTMKEYVYSDEYGLRFLSCIELERLQTVSDNYTSCVSKSQRRKLLGNGWTVDVIKHILSFITSK